MTTVEILLFMSSFWVNTVCLVKLPQSSNVQPLAWWQQEVIYQIYPRSFQDSDDDGIGDLVGIQSRLNYFTNLGIGAIWISPIYPSPMKDFGYDISNFTGIEPTFGTLESFQNLSQALKQRGIRLIMDFVPNHTSDLHPWFNASIHREHPYTDYYVWRNASSYDSQGRALPPNNWVSVFGGSMWEWSEERKQFYLHQFLKEQPDLNVENPRVLNELLAAMKIWLDRGVDGFRVDAVPHLFEDLEEVDREITDEHESPDRPPNSIPWDYAFWEHEHTYNLPACLDFLAEMRRLLDVYTLADGKERVMMVEATVPAPKLFEYYGTSEKPVAHFPFNFELINGLPHDGELDATQLERIVNVWFENLLEGQCANWLVGNHDNDRVASRFGEEFVDFFNMLVLLLPGNAVTYYGEEIGMHNVNVSWEDTVDPSGKNAGSERFRLFSRDPARSPMQFSAKKNGGFSMANHTWLPLHPNYQQVNVQTQEQECEDGQIMNSHLKVYKMLVKLRDSDVWRYGSLETKVIHGKTEDEDGLSSNPKGSSGKVFGFARIFDGKGFMVLTNLGKNETVEVNAEAEFEGVPPTATVYTRSVVQIDDFAEQYLIGSAVNTSSILLDGKDAIVLEF